MTRHQSWDSGSESIPSMRPLAIPSTRPLSQHLDRPPGDGNDAPRSDVRLVGRPVPIDLARIEPGQELLGGRYTVLRILGRGGMGVVLLVRNNELGVERALKLILPSLADEPAMVLRFIREARVLARVHHEQIVRVHAASLTETDLVFRLGLLMQTPSPSSPSRRLG